MRAAVLHGRRDVRIEDRPRPEPRVGELLLRVTRSGICGTDAGEYAHGPRMVPLEHRHPASGHRGPMTLGHEFVGVVDGLGADVDDAWSGRRVASGAGVSCGTCAWCRAGRTNLCAHYWTVGLSADGGLAGFVRVPATTCVEIPTGCSDDAAALAQPLAVGLHAASRAGIGPGDTVVLVGAGAIGSFLLCGLLSVPPARLIVTDVDPVRLAAARALLDAETVDARGTDSVGAVLELTGGEGAQVVIEASGAPGTAQAAMRMAARGGRVLLVGLPAGPQQLDLADATLREVELCTTVAHVCADDLPQALQLLASRDLLAHLLDRVIPLGDVVEGGLEVLLAGMAGGKILVDPHA